MNGKGFEHSQRWSSSCIDGPWFGFFFCTSLNVSHLRCPESVSMLGGVGVVSFLLWATLFWGTRHPLLYRCIEYLLKNMNTCLCSYVSCNMIHLYRYLFSHYVLPSTTVCIESCASSQTGSHFVCEAVQFFFFIILPNQHTGLAV